MTVSEVTYIYMGNPEILVGKSNGSPLTKIRAPIVYFLYTNSVHCMYYIAIMYTFSIHQIYINQDLAWQYKNDVYINNIDVYN